MEIPESWRSFLDDEIRKPYFRDLENLVEKEYQEHTCFPPKDLIFAAFEKCNFDNLKVVIIGQDPYHGAGEANGLCFSVNDGVAIPPSLRNIFREISNDLDTIMQPTSGNLEHWAAQGVLLLNATLTVRKDQPNSHKHLPWQRLTDAIIEKIAAESQHIVFLLWGGFAQKKGAKIDRKRHLVLACGHPSPLSANQGKWFGNKQFSLANTYLQSKNIDPITWFSSLL